MWRRQITIRFVDPPHFLFDWVEERTHTGMLRIAGAETLRGIPVAAVKGGLGRYGRRHTTRGGTHAPGTQARRVADRPPTLA